MGDVADILGLESQKQDEISRLLNEKARPVSKTKAKPKGVSRELYALMGDGGIAPAVQTNAGSVFKDKRQRTLEGKWVWAPFKNPARSDDLECFHWIKADQMGFDYPYAKFNKKTEAIVYTDAEYESFLQTPRWTRSETDHLMFLCFQYDLRWPVIADRYEPTSPRTTEELMTRYYFVLSKLKAHRAGQVDFTTRNMPYTSFNVEYERARRKQQDLLFHRTEEQDVEEKKIREEIKSIDATLKKMKKTSKHGTSSTTATTSASASLPRGSGPPVAAPPVQPESAAAALSPPIMMYGGGLPDPTGTGLHPGPGRPCLQSARLALHSEQNQSLHNPELSRSFMKKVVLLLQELGMPDRLLPTRVVCDMNDQIRRDAATLLSLQNTITQKEKELVALKASMGMDTGGGVSSNGTPASRHKNRADSSFIVPHGSVLVKQEDLTLSEHYLAPSARAIVAPPPPPQTRPAAKAGPKKSGGGGTKGTKRKAAAITQSATTAPAGGDNAAPPEEGKNAGAAASAGAGAPAAETPLPVAAPGTTVAAAPTGKQPAAKRPKKK